MDKVLLLTMPFSFADRPSLGLSLLRGLLNRRGIACDIRYLQLQFAEQMGYSNYYWIAQHAPRMLIGEWLFAHLLFENNHSESEGYIRYISDNQIFEISEALISKLPGFRALASDFIEACVRDIDWRQYAVIGITSTFAQNAASLALAHRVKEAYPDKTIVFGGANCEGEMGLELLRRFPFIDFVCSGESDWLFPELIERLGARRSIEDLPGLIYRRNGQALAEGILAPPIFDLDALPIPDFDDYFTQLEGSGLRLTPADATLMVETSRGCWWGSKSQCTFCGVNQDSMVYRSKSSERVLEEFHYLAGKYPAVNKVEAVDKILNYQYFRDVIPGLINNPPGFKIFYFTKANLDKEKLHMLKQAGITRIQPGIESLDNEVLGLMRKGCSTVQNIQLLKWATEIGIQVIWNFISGFPGEDPRAYQQMAEMMPAIVHLQPPTGPADQVRLDRFSPYFQEPSAYGICNVRPAEAYKYVYPFPEDSLGRLAYYFDFDYVDGRIPGSYIQPLDESIRRWYQQPNNGTLVSLRTNGRITLYDTRPSAKETETSLVGIAYAVYELCDEGQSFEGIMRYLKRHHSSQANRAEVQAILNELVEKRLMLHIDKHYLSLALSMDKPVQEFIESFVNTVNRHHQPSEASTC